MRRRGAWTRSRLTAAAALAGLGALTGSALAAFPADAPNDPNYAPSEDPGALTCAQRSVNEEQHYLYDFMPRCAPNATDPEGAAGGSVNRAWREFTTGRPDTVIAYIEGGINWHNHPEELANRVFLNAGELPPPTTPVDDGALNARDYSDTDDANSNGVVDPEDIIVRFSDGKDDDGNRYPDDISGWDFYDNQNNPATYDSTYDHSDGQMIQAAAETDNGSVDAGICPSCMIMPIKAGAEALDRTDDLAEAFLYATDLKASVIVSVTADLGYSSFMRQAVQRAWERGLIMVESSNDFDSTDHQGGMFHPFVIPGNGLVSNTQGLDTVPGSASLVNSLTTTYRARSGETSWGTHNVFSAATSGGSTSESTPTIGGTLALVSAYGREAADRGLISQPLTGAEVIQVVRDTASDIDDPGSNWPSGPGWDLQFGYGRPNAFQAMKAISEGAIPPVGWITKPDWYSLYDPMHTGTVGVRGHVDDPRSKAPYSWRLEWAPGAEPVDSDFVTAGSGKRRKKLDGRLGKIDLSRVPQSIWNQQFQLSQGKTLETNEQFTVTLRLRVTDDQGLVSEDRRTIAVHHDPSLLPGFPVEIGPGGEGQAALVDLQGKGRLAAVFGDSDGFVHAIDGKTGRELRGFPAKTLRTQVQRKHRGINPGREPIFTNVAVGDIDGNGRLSIVATTSTGRTYVWNSRGKRRKGWPQSLSLGVQPPPSPRPQLEYTRLPIQGATSPPVLYDLDGDGRLEILQSAWDGHLYAWRGDGSAVPGWPVEVTLPAGHEPPSGYVRVEDHKLDTPPAIADLDGDGSPEIVVRSQYTDVRGSGLQPLAVSHLHAYHADGTPVAGWPVDVQALIAYYGSAQEPITEGIATPSAADTDGNGDDEIAFAPGIFSPTALLEGDGSQAAVYGPVDNADIQLFTGNLNALLDLLNGQLPVDSPVNFTTSGAFGRFGPANQLAYAEPGSGAASVAGALLLTGSGVGINNYIRVHDPRSGAAVEGFPARLQGLDFLGAPAFADVSGDGGAEILVGGDTSALHAYAPGGAQAPGFPKFHTGWEVWGPSIGDLDSDGSSDVVAVTREGYVLAWGTPGDPAGNQEWWSYRHDERNTGRYGVDTRPPGALRRGRAIGKRDVVRFRAPGDDWYAGQAAEYHVVIRLRGGGTDTKTVAASPAGRVEEVGLPPRARNVKLFALDEAGNRSPTLKLRVGPRPGHGHH